MVMEKEQWVVMERKWPGCDVERRVGVMEREQWVTMERKWPGGDVERREGRVGVMKREQ